MLYRGSTASPGAFIRCAPTESLRRALEVSRGWPVLARVFRSCESGLWLATEVHESVPHGEYGSRCVRHVVMMPREPAVAIEMLGMWRVRGASPGQELEWLTSDPYQQRLYRWVHEGTPHPEAVEHVASRRARCQR